MLTLLSFFVVLLCGFGLYVSMCQLPAIADAWGDRVAGMSLVSMFAMWISTMLFGLSLVWGYVL